MKSTDKAKLEEFILTAVQMNAKIRVEGTGPTSALVTVQQLLNDTSTATLEAFYVWLKKQPATVGSTRRGTTSKTYISGVATIEEVAEIVDIIIADREEKAEAQSVKAERKDLEDQLESLETPEEKKDKIRKKLAALPG